MIHFPKIIKSRVVDYSPLLTLSIKDDVGMIYIREYFKVKYINKTELVFMTTNEFDFNFIPRFLRDEFCLIENFEQLVDGFENSDFVNTLTNARFNSPPKYIYYTIEMINEFIKPLFLSHLRESILGFAEDDFNNEEKAHLKRWFACLRTNEINQ